MAEPIFFLIFREVKYWYREHFRLFRGMSVNIIYTPKNAFPLTTNNYYSYFIIFYSSFKTSVLSFKERGFSIFRIGQYRRMSVTVSSLINLNRLELFYRFQTLHADSYRLGTITKRSSSIIVTKKSLSPFKTCWFFYFLYNKFVC